METVWIILLVILAAAVIAALAVLIFRPHFGKAPGADPEADPRKEKGLSSFTFSSSGDMEGGHYHLTLQRLPSGEAQIEITEQTTHNAKTASKRAAAGPELLGELERVIREAGMQTWGDLPQSEIVALDAATSHVTYIFDGKLRSYSSDQIFPEGGWQAVRRIVRIIEEHTGFRHR